MNFQLFLTFSLKNSTISKNALVTLFLSTIMIRQGLRSTVELVIRVIAKTFTLTTTNNKNGPLLKNMSCLLMLRILLCK